MLLVLTKGENCMDAEGLPGDHCQMPSSTLSTTSWPSHFHVLPALALEDSNGPVPKASTHSSVPSDPNANDPLWSGKAFLALLRRFCIQVRSARTSALAPPHTNPVSAYPRWWSNPMGHPGRADQEEVALQRERVIWSAEPLSKQRAGEHIPGAPVFSMLNGASD